MSSTGEKILYEFAIIRYLPSVEREEFLNIGLIMMSKRRRWIKIMICYDYNRLRLLGNVHPEDTIKLQLQSFIDIANGKLEAGPIACYPVEERFRWLTAPRSTCIQTSNPHPGLTFDLDRTFNKIFNETVLVNN